MYTIMTWDEVDLVRLGSATRSTLVFLERYGRIRKLVNRERPEQPGNGEEQDALGNINPRADATTE